MSEPFDQPVTMTDIDHESESSHTSASKSSIAAAAVAAAVAPVATPVVAAAVAPAAFEDGIDTSHLPDEFRKIPLASSEDGQSFETLKSLILAVNEHVGPRGYAVTLNRITKSKLGVRRKA